MSVRPVTPVTPIVVPPRGVPSKGNGYHDTENLTPRDYIVGTDAQDELFAPRYSGLRGDYFATRGTRALAFAVILTIVGLFACVALLINR